MEQNVPLLVHCTPVSRGYRQTIPHPQPILTACSSWEFKGACSWFTPLPPKRTTTDGPGKRKRKSSLSVKNGSSTPWIHLFERHVFLHASTSNEQRNTVSLSDWPLSICVWYHLLHTSCMGNCFNCDDVLRRYAGKQILQNPTTLDVIVI